MSDLQYTKEAFDRVNEVIEKVHGWYYEEVPRFTVKGMNQAEFINHLVTIGFNRGIDFAEKALSEIKKEETNETRS